MVDRLELVSIERRKPKGVITEENYSERDSVVLCWFTEQGRLRFKLTGNSPTPFSFRRISREKGAQISNQ
ncbi:MAG: hypothetical protein ACLFPV_05405 [Spirochaetaceae bacterium]